MPSVTRSPDFTSQSFAVPLFAIRAYDWSASSTGTVTESISCVALPLYKAIHVGSVVFTFTERCSAPLFGWLPSCSTMSCRPLRFVRSSPFGIWLIRFTRSGTLIFLSSTERSVVTYIPRMLYVENEMLAISSHAFLAPYSSIRLVSFTVITSFSLMLASIWAIIGSEVTATSAPNKSFLIFIIFIKYVLLYI